MVAGCDPRKTDYMSEYSVLLPAVKLHDRPGTQRPAQARRERNPAGRHASDDAGPRGTPCPPAVEPQNFPAPCISRMNSRIVPVKGTFLLKSKIRSAASANWSTDSGCSSGNNTPSERK